MAEMPMPTNFSVSHQPFGGGSNNLNRGHIYNMGSSLVKVPTTVNFIPFKWKGIWSFKFLQFSKAKIFYLVRFVKEWLKAS